jgi:hypothetical protein
MMAEENVAEAPIASEAPIAEAPVEAQAPETPVEAQTPDTPAESPKEAPVRGEVPSEYKLPEGFSPEVATWAKDMGLTQEQLDGSIEQMKTVASGVGQQEKVMLRSAGEAHVKNWGDDRKPNTQLVKRALESFDPSGDLTKLLNERGFINHPVVLDAFLAHGKSLREGGFIRMGNSRPTGERTVAQAMYPDHPSKE